MDPGFELNEIDKLLIDAVCNSDRQGIMNALNQGADINTWDGGSTCIGYAFSDPALLQFLIDHGADPKMILREHPDDEGKVAWGDLGYIFIEDYYEELDQVPVETWIQTLKVLQNAGVEIRKPFLTYNEGMRTLVDMIEQALQNHSSEYVRDVLNQVRNFLIM